MNIQTIILENGTNKILIDKMTDEQFEKMRSLLQTVFSVGQFENADLLVNDLSINNVLPPQ